jgi:hypothetical protein
MKQSKHQTRVERLLGAPLADGAVRRWPQSGEFLRGKTRIAVDLNAYFYFTRFVVPVSLNRVDTNLEAERRRVI